MNAIATRRDVFAGLALAAWSLPVVAAAQGAPPLGWTPLALSPDQARALSAATETIMPTTDTPGAVAAGVPQYVDRAIATWCAPADAERLKAGLTQLDDKARGRQAASFAALSADQRTAVLNEVEAEFLAAERQRQPHYWRSLKDLTTSGYFTSQLGATKALRYDPRPGAYHGCVPVKEIGRGWATT
jgi:hypothetical protein